MEATENQITDSESKVSNAEEVELGMALFHLGGLSHKFFFYVSSSKKSSKFFLTFSSPLSIISNYHYHTQFRFLLIYIYTYFYQPDSLEH